MRETVCQRAWIPVQRDHASMVYTLGDMPGYRILFATVPADGHFVPLTGIAMALRARGHDVRWYV